MKKALNYSIEINQRCFIVVFLNLGEEKMKNKFTDVVIASLMLVCLVFSACFIEFEPPPPSGGWGYPDLFTGTVDGTGRGYGAGGVSVNIDLVDGFITDVDFDFTNETAMFVSTLADRLRPLILRSNSFNFPDATGGASVTNRGVKAAAREALLKIEGVTEADLDF